MSKWRKKSVVIEAFKWTGDQNQSEDPVWINEAYRRGDVRYDGVGTNDMEMFISTLEGVMTARPGDYIIQGIEGEIYPCKASIFEKTYESAGEIMSFGAAVEALKAGKRVARAGWNGRVMWLTLVPACRYNPSDVNSLGLEKLPWIGMKTADNKFVPWLASQTDVLAEDWQVIE
ncbi:DUF2829 domain-containing protein [Paenibacillus durus]|uniref:Thoeris anti-defense 2-like domain-containing protein n=1 Tax=Paenibacillus durus ATCC 35681 TaxID=1333534 RepID=A0A0F7FBK5_PAEDU|nr:DUF2829 domain-containing protein [Paenibacillus durus]AKG36102.1 hypothetical protein VK70_17330 [Paenibacillus durus ATCC 35681]